MTAKIGSTIAESCPQNHDFLRLNPALFKGMDTANPSGKFWIPIPIPSATAAPKVYTFANSGITKAPKATPTANPSGILWMAIAKTNNEVFLRSVFGPSASFIFPKICKWGIDLSKINMKRAPKKNPMAGGKNDGKLDWPNSFWTSTAWIAGAIKDQKLAAIITPPVKPRAASKIFLLEDLKKKTNPAPKAVNIQVNNPAYNACKTGLVSDLKNSNIDSNIFVFKSSPVQN